MEAQTVETCRRKNAEGQRCGKPLDRTGSPKWCKECWAAYHKDYQPERQETKMEMSESRGYCAGITAMRRHLAAKFQRLGSGPTSGAEVAMWILQDEGPK